jgi:hypothetical protein
VKVDFCHAEVVKIVVVVKRKRKMAQKEEEIHEFRVGGEPLRISRKGADYKLAAIKDPGDPRKYYVKYQGQKIPVKRALNALDHNFLRAGFNTTQAISILKTLGYEVGQEE